MMLPERFIFMGIFTCFGRRLLNSDVSEEHTAIVQRVKESNNSTSIFGVFTIIIIHIVIVLGLLCW